MAADKIGPYATYYNPARTLLSIKKDAPSP